MNKLECANLIKTLYGAYPNTKMDNPQGMITSYMMILGAYDAETVYKAARMYMSNAQNRYFPKAAELNKYIPLAPFMFNASDVEALPSGADPDENDDGASMGCDLCPYNELGCTKEKCIV